MDTDGQKFFKCQISRFGPIGLPVVKIEDLRFCRQLDEHLRGIEACSFDKVLLAQLAGLGAWSSGIEGDLRSYQFCEMRLHIVAGRRHYVFTGSFPGKSDAVIHKEDMNLVAFFFSHCCQLKAPGTPSRVLRAGGEYKQELCHPNLLPFIRTR
jgi:hypothetical protein